MEKLYSFKSGFFSHYFSLNSASVLRSRDRVRISLTHTRLSTHYFLIFCFLLDDKRENNCNNFVLLFLSLLSLSLSLSVFAGPVHLPDIWGVQHRGKSALCLKAVGVNERNDKFLMGTWETNST